MKTETKNRELLEVVISNAQIVMAGPLGYRQRQELIVISKAAQTELDGHKPKVCPVCEDSACEVKSCSCGR